MKNIKRQPATVLTEENLRGILNVDTVKLNLEHHYWLKDNFLNKLGRLAPNLQILSLRRMAISNASFIDIFRYLEKVEVLDIADSPNIEESGMEQFLDSCGENLTKLQASNCQLAITDGILGKLTETSSKLRILDISYCKLVTDDGLKAFENKSLPIEILCMTGLGNAVTGLGLSYPITACKDSLRTFEAALMRSEALKLPDWGKALGACLGLESLDVSGCRALTDDFFMQMCNFEIKNKDNTVTKPGF